MSKNRKQRIKDYPEEFKEMQRKSAETRSTPAARKSSRERTIQRIKDNPEKHEETMRKSAETHRTPAVRETARENTTKYFKDNPKAKEIIAEQQKGIQKEKYEQTKSIKRRCRELVKNQDINITPPHHNSGVKKWQDFENSLIMSIFFNQQTPNAV